MKERKEGREGVKKEARWKERQTQTHKHKSRNHNIQATTNKTNYFQRMKYGTKHLQK